jgi:hypothetical protein
MIRSVSSGAGLILSQPGKTSSSNSRGAVRSTVWQRRQNGTLSPLTNWHKNRTSCREDTSIL